VITARLVGDDAVLAWLRATPDVVASGLARAVAKLGLDLQRKIQEGDLTAQMLSDRSFQPSSDAQIEQSGDKISVTVSAGSEYAGARQYAIAGTAALRTNLRRRTEAFRRPRSEKAMSVRGYRHRTDLTEGAFMRAALDDMEPAIRDEVEAALRQALTR
jgi:hypothetical protein